jgi:hypothetical protein
LREQANVLDYLEQLIKVQSPILEDIRNNGGKEIHRLMEGCCCGNVIRDSISLAFKYQDLTKNGELVEIKD